MLTGPEVVEGEWSEGQRTKSHKLCHQRVPRLKRTGAHLLDMDPGKEADGWDSETQNGPRESLTPRSGEGMEGNALCLPGQFNKRLLSTFSVSGWAERVVVM